MVNYKKGDKVRIISNCNSNGFSESGSYRFGTILTLLRRDGNHNHNGEGWNCEEREDTIFRSNDFELVDDNKIIEIW